MVEPVRAGMNTFLWTAYAQSGRNHNAQGAPAANEAGAAEDRSALKLSDKDLKRLGLKECKTCQSRSYVDVSNDPGVSMKTPTRLSPEEAATAVRSHESEHVARESGKAEMENRHVVFQSVQIYTRICPECGRFYTSGGKTTTVTAADSSSQIAIAGEKGQLFNQVA